MDPLDSASSSPVLVIAQAFSAEGHILAFNSTSSGLHSCRRRRLLPRPPPTRSRSQFLACCLVSLVLVYTLSLPSRVQWIWLLVSIQLHRRNCPSVTLDCRSRRNSAWLSCMRCWRTHFLQASEGLPHSEQCLVDMSASTTMLPVIVK